MKEYKTGFSQVAGIQTKDMCKLDMRNSKIIHTNAYPRISMRILIILLISVCQGYIFLHDVIDNG